MPPDALVTDIGSRVLYRDGLMLVIDKPAGLPVHPGPKGGETLTDHLDGLRFGLPRRPEAAHRLDRDTSGCLVLGRHPKALAKLGALFRDNRVRKTYWAVVEGGPGTDEGEIDLGLSRRSPDPRSWWMKADPAGLPSLTHYRVLARGAQACLLALEPVTGRTHQLRVHCAASGFPIRGDAVYGTAPRDAALLLHAQALALPLYPRRDPVAVEAPVPGPMAAAIAALSSSQPAAVAATSSATG